MAEPKTLTFFDTPLSGKFRFQTRSLGNWAFAFAVFIVWAVLVAPFQFRWIADALGIGILFYLMFFLWEKRAIKIRCHHCHKILRTNTPWVCGFRQCKNERTDDFPFVHRCEHCGAEPKAYKCHHCGEIIFLTEDQLKANYATCLNSPSPMTEEEVDRSGYEGEKRKLEYKLHLAGLNNQVRAAEKFGEHQREKAPQEKVEASWAKRRAFTVSAAQVYKREKAALTKEFGDDAEMLEWAIEALDDWYKSGEWERVL